MMIRYVERHLYIDGHDRVLDASIDEAFECDGVVVALLDPDTDREARRRLGGNVVGYDASGSQLWVPDHLS
jgi:hypothetical protein